MVTKHITKNKGDIAVWSVSAPGYISQSGEVVVNGDTTLTVILERDERFSIVTFNPGGGSMDTEVYQYTIGEPYGTLPEPVYYGHKFDGWYTSQTGGTKVEVTDIVEDQERTLYAHWISYSDFWAIWTGGYVYLNDSSRFNAPSVSKEQFTSNVVQYEFHDITGIESIDDSHITSMEDMFRYSPLISTVPTLDSTKVKNVSNMFQNCTSLTNFGGLQGLGTAYDNGVSKGNGSLDLHYCPLTHQSALNVLNGLSSVDPSKEYTITFNSSVHLTESEVQIATSMGWIITGFTPIITTITVTFNANGGTTPTSSKSVTIGEEYGTLPVPTYPGFEFKGWFTSFSGTIQITESTIVTETANHTLYAQWRKVTKPVVVSFNPNGGTTPISTKTVIYGETYGTLPTPTYSGHTFTGWNTSQSGVSRIITENSTVEIDTDHTLYAWWDVEQYTVTFNPNGGTTPTSSKTVTYGSTYGTLPVPTYIGYEFQGWYTSSSGGTKITENTTVTITSNQTLYAHWTEDPYADFWAVWSGGTTGDTYYSTIIGDIKYYDLSSPIVKSNYSGNMTYLSFCKDHPLDRPLLKSVEYIDGTYLTSCYRMFTLCSGLKTVSQFDTSNVTDMSYMFADCSLLKSIPLLDTSNVKSFFEIFLNCGHLIELPEFNTSSVTDFDSMCDGCYSLEYVPELNASSADYIMSMFLGCTSLTNFGGLQGLGTAYSSDISVNRGSLDLHWSPLTHESALNVLNGLANVDSSVGYKVTFSTSTYNTLTSSEIAIGSQKGWRITSA